jgi:hypothetical protein
MFKIRTSKYRHVFCDQPKPEVSVGFFMSAATAGLVFLGGNADGGRAATTAGCPVEAREGTALPSTLGTVFLGVALWSCLL